ncbi:YpzG family protein [Cytobacillus suaedae]|uniref:YpzG family protein n=1 Tax=Cytobacillus sp. S13-E01 TaxID=3031326 RepID=UPI001876CAD4|nr:YpzG family protein [Cytobacillus sp. S13-E01]MDF0725917.1 YpzG family protein [Cytobacillus sp. S13-E01]QOR67086.1 YpzG family protein [Cytobacillus suaedae]
MGKHTKKKFYDNLYSNPFQQAWANPKHSWAQVNGETKQTQNLIILENQTRKRS